MHGSRVIDHARDRGLLSLVGSACRNTRRTRGARPSRVSRAARRRRRHRIPRRAAGCPETRSSGELEPARVPRRRASSGARRISSRRRSSGHDSSTSTPSHAATGRGGRAGRGRVEVRGQRVEERDDRVEQLSRAHRAGAGRSRRSGGRAPAGATQVLARRKRRAARPSVRRAPASPPSVYRRRRSAVAYEPCRRCSWSSGLRKLGLDDVRAGRDQLVGARARCVLPAGLGSCFPVPRSVS